MELISRLRRTHPAGPVRQLCDEYVRLAERVVAQARVISELNGQVTRLLGQMATMDRKATHGCYGASCAECDPAAGES